MERHRLAREEDFARSTVLQALEQATQLQTQPLVVQQKQRGEPVSTADRQVNDFIVSAIRGAFPGDAVVAEESYGESSRWYENRRVWFVDPIDGTREYLEGLDQWAVMVGLTLDGQPSLGVVGIKDALAWAVRGRGAWMQPLGGERESLSVGHNDDIRSWRLVSSRSHHHPLLDDICQQLGITHWRRLGSVGYKVSRLTGGEADVYIHPSSRTKLWDICGPQVILEEAGGRMTDMYGRSLSYAGPDVYNRDGFVASNGTRHDEITRVTAAFAART